MNVTKIKICPKCKGQNPAHLVECGTCGFDLMNVKITDSTVAALQTPKSAPAAEAPMVRICSECGTANVAQARKCTKCGEDISDIRPTCKRQNKVQDKAQEKTGRFCLSSVEDDYAFDLLAKSSSVFLGRTAGMGGYLKDRAYVGRRQAKLTFEAGKIFIENANCKCKLDTCTVELSESERRSGWKPLASVLGDAGAAFGCVNRVEELVKQFLRGTIAQFLARSSV